VASQSGKVNGDFLQNIDFLRITYIGTEYEYTVYFFLRKRVLGYGKGNFGLDIKFFEDEVKSDIPCNFGSAM